MLLKTAARLSLPARGFLDHLASRSFTWTRQLIVIGWFDQRANNLGKRVTCTHVCVRQQSFTHSVFVFLPLSTDVLTTTVDKNTINANSSIEFFISGNKKRKPDRPLWRKSEETRRKTKVDSIWVATCLWKLTPRVCFRMIWKTLYFFKKHYPSKNLLRGESLRSPERKKTIASPKWAEPSAAAPPSSPPWSSSRSRRFTEEGKHRPLPGKMSAFQKENDAAKSLFRRLEVFIFNVI